MAVMNEEQTNPKALVFREILESRVFGAHNKKSEALLEQVRGAMSDLQALLFPKDSRKELSWAMSWLSKVGIDVINPATR